MKLKIASSHSSLMKMMKKKRFLLHRSEIERNAFVLVVAPLCPFVQVFVSAASLLCKY